MRRRPAALQFHRRSPVQALVDFVLAVGAYWLAFRMRFDLRHVSEVSPKYADLFDNTWYLVGLSVVLAIWAIGGYHRPWRHTDGRDDFRTGQGVVVGLLLFLGLNGVLHPATWVSASAGLTTTYPPPSIYGLAAVLGLMLIVGARVVVRAVSERSLLFGLGRRRSGRSALIVGAGSGGRLVLREMVRNPQLGVRPVGFVDDDPAKQRTRVDGVRVHGRITDLTRILDELEPDEIIIAIPSAPGTLRADVLRAGRSRGVPVRTLPTVFELLQAGEGAAVRQVREVGVEDVLGREPVRMELDRVGAYLRDRTVLVTGAGGSIGGELCRQIARVGPAKLVLLDHAEDNLFRIERELIEDRQVPEARVTSVIADVKEGDRIREVLREHGPDVVFHAAAYKHVGLMEANPVEAVRNNAIATRQLARLCGETEVERFVLVSTDKAVRPATAMGASKALAELAVESAAQRWTGTRFSCVRFGNVLGSSGSVVPIFQRQIARGGPVTVTDPEMTRYFMTIPEAVQLVIQSGSVGRSGEILVLDMGRPVKIMQLARDMIELSGLQPDEDIAIEVIGPRPGEKLHEELFNGFERPATTDAERIQRAARTPFRPDAVEAMFDEIALLVLEGDAAGVAAKVEELQRTHTDGSSGPRADRAAGEGPPGSDVTSGSSAYTGPL